jgi:NRPS condensation-like uncharacterized protein
MTPNGSTTTSVPLNLLDELFLNLDRDDEPWGVHLEVRARGRLDADRLADALGAAVRRHPIARARLAPWRSSERTYHWRIDDDPAPVPLAIVSCADDAALGAARERWYAFSPSLEAPPPFAVLLVRGPAGDSLMLNLHHAAGDAIGAVRLMRSILRAYAGEPDPGPLLDPLAVREVRELTRSRSVPERRGRRRARGRQAVRNLMPAARVAREGSDTRAGYGFELLSFSSAETAAIVARRPPGATVNDVLLGALAVTIRGWNAAHGRRTARIALTMPVNLRPAPWRTEVLANFASYVTVSLHPADAGDVTRATGAISEHTREVKRDGLAGLVVDDLVVPGMLTIAAKRRLQDLIPLTGDVLVDTASLSNLGVIDAMPLLGEGAGLVEDVWFSPPMRMPLGAAFGVATIGGRLHATLRYRHPQFDRAGARSFARRYRDALLS